MARFLSATFTNSTPAMSWLEEKAELLATIRRQEQDATALARRFKLLQRALTEQQQLLDRYQRALLQSGIEPPAAASANSVTRRVTLPDRTVEAAPPATKTSPSASTATVSTGPDFGANQPPTRSNDAWRQRRTADLESVPPPAAKSVPPPVSKSPKPVEPPIRAAKSTKRGVLASTWAEEKQRLPKKVRKEKPKQVTPGYASGSEKENRQKELKDKPFAYVEVVRHRETRDALPAHDCGECRKYYEALGGLVTEEDAAALKRKCSRHRARFEPYQTPDDFWRLSFPDSGEAASHTL
ncbi:hypothetical protein BBJ28_00020370 [Nothophytophthora sp. Chile5]|nr:hypothetical protein BBJ28_00020370 [Nothophytophthora sp. Chile5]